MKCDFCNKNVSEKNLYIIKVSCFRACETGQSFFYKGHKKCVVKRYYELEDTL